MYKEYWRITKKPFENTTDAGFLYCSLDHQEAFSRMSYAVKEHKTGFFLTGEYGTGKTLLSKALIRECSDDKFKFVIISNPRVEPLEFIKEINYQLNGSGNPSQVLSKPDYLRCISEALNKNYKDGLYTVIIIDEAQSIEHDSLLEEIRLLLNNQRDDSVLFTLLLLGELSFEDKLDKKLGLKQRFSIRYSLSPLDKEDTMKYIRHRLSVSGLNKDIFTDSGYDEIYNLSRGVPRVINNIADLALLTGFIQHKDMVDRDILAQVGKDLQLSVLNN